MQDYQERQEARKARYLERAERARTESASQFQRSHDATAGIPFGQPILVGHHSEGRHRAALRRSDNAIRKSIDADSRASHYETKAAGVGKAGISSDDPEAVAKIKAKIAKLEAMQELMRGANKAIRAAYKHGIREDGPAENIATLQSALLKATGKEWNEAETRALLAPDFAGRRGFASYQLTNNNANTRRLKERLKTLEASQDAEHVETQHDGFQVVENIEENRVQITFPGKPDAETRTLLKRHGFRWSRYNMAWQRHLNTAGRYAAQQVTEKLEG